MRGRLPSAYEIMRHSDPRQFGVPAIVVAELNYGIERSKKLKENRLLTERFSWRQGGIPKPTAVFLGYAPTRFNEFYQAWQDAPEG